MPGGNEYSVAFGSAVTARGVGRWRERFTYLGDIAAFVVPGVAGRSRVHPGPGLGGGANAQALNLNYVHLRPSERMWVVVGGNGALNAGGYNGGGGASGGGYGGGGATDLRQGDPNNLDHRVCVAGASGGRNSGAVYGNVGGGTAPSRAFWPHGAQAGGYLMSDQYTTVAAGGGGGSSSGGAGGTGYTGTDGSPGTLGAGGAGGPGAGGGGGGYYGGGGGETYSTDGGGGGAGSAHTAIDRKFSRESADLILMTDPTSTGGGGLDVYYQLADIGRAPTARGRRMR